ncbi:hypothetical protein [Flavobacterium sp.]|uniref:hypothetical protein n=1 Tax=Flavobacterium sp. TaxID=239 RepID=UPI00286E761C|nr:hypothetical protein [Flavobacterium sp.]
MKTLKTIFVCAILLFTSVNIHASNKVDDMALKMTNSPEVIQLIKNKMVLTIIQGIDFVDQTPESILNEIKKREINNFYLASKVKNSFPDFEYLNINEQTEIMNKILYSPNLGEWWDCANKKLALFGSAMLGVAVSAGALSFFKKCVLSVIFSDLIAAIVDPALIATEAEAATPEVRFCKFLAVRTTQFEGALLIILLTAVGTEC